MRLPSTTLLGFVTLLTQVAITWSFSGSIFSGTPLRPIMALSSTTTKDPIVTIPPENVRAIQGLEPTALWKHFSVISSIPRPSKQEHAILAYIQSVADQYGLEWKQDEVGNMVVFRPGTGAGVDADPIILQGHVDMVTEKNAATSHDFNRDPILLELVSSPSSSSSWLTAKGTTLGADNGIGVAAALALLEDDSSHNMPPLQLLFTVDEETGLTGATQLNVAALGLTGKTLLNLDTEEWGELYVGCAGGGETTLTLDLTRRSDNSSNDIAVTHVELRVEGLLGGHSGINIHEGRANAVLLCAAAVQAILTGDGVEASLVSISGGDKHNAIPREARAVLSIPSDKQDIVEAIVQTCFQNAKAEYGLLEKNLNIKLVEYCKEEHDACLDSMKAESAHRLVSLLLGLPHGPLKFSHAMPDLVETSNNVASVMTITDDGNNHDQAVILCSTRSSVASALEATRDRLAAVATLAGATIERSEAYPGWNPNLESPLLQIAQGILKEQLGTIPGVKAIHAGLECGLLIEKLGGDVDALSFGPTITGAHSPDESILVDTVPPFYQLVKDILGKLVEKKTSYKSPSSSSVTGQQSSPTGQQHFIGIDLGTSGCRISVLQQDKQEVYTQAILWKDRCSYDDPSGWIDSVKSLIRDASAAVNGLDTTLRSICVSGTSASCVLMDTKTGEASTSARMYDFSVSSLKNGKDVLDRLAAAAPPKHTAVSPTGSLAKLLAWQAESPLSDTQVLVHQADFVVSHLCHDDNDFKVVSDWHNCLKLGYDVRKLEWPSWLTKLLESEGLDAKLVLPDEVFSPGQIVGTIGASVAAELNIPVNTKLVGGTTDSNAAFMAAAGTPSLGTAVTSLGSTTAIKLLSPVYVEDATFGVYSHRFPQVLLAEYGDHSDDNNEAWLVGGASNVGCAIFRKLEFGNEELAELSKAIDPMMRSPLEYYPLLNTGERFPVADPNKQPKLEPIPDTRQEYLHGLLESITKVEIDGYARLAAMGAPWPLQVWTCGGGARNPTWIRMRQARLQEKCSNRDISVAVAHNVEASYGAALLASALFVDAPKTS